MRITELLSIGAGNAKLPDSTLTLALPSGFTCPGALACLAMADRDTGKITDGPHQEFRCYEASAESRFPSVRASRWRNFELLKGLGARDCGELLAASVTAARNHKSERVRLFTGGDCFSGALRDGILAAARYHRDLIWYYYTKNLPLLLQHPGEAVTGGTIHLPRNLRITASWGGRFDHLIEAGLFPRSARVLHTHQEAEAAGLPVDFNDRLAWQDEPTHFCHLSHGGQPAGSAAGQAIRQRKRAGAFSGYGKGRAHAACA